MSVCHHCRPALLVHDRQHYERRYGEMVEWGSDNSSVPNFQRDIQTAMEGLDLENVSLQDILKTMARQVSTFWNSQYGIYIYMIYLFTEGGAVEGGEEGRQPRQGGPALPHRALRLQPGRPQDEDSALEGLGCRNEEYETFITLLPRWYW